MRKLLLALPVAAVALGMVAAAPVQAAGHGATGHGSSGHGGSGHGGSGHGGSGHGGSGHGGSGHGASGNKAAPLKAVSAKAPSTFLAASLSGAAEVPTAGGPAVGDPQGKGVALVRVKGDRVSFSVSYSGIQAPSLGHIHEGKAGVNGPVKVTLFGTALPATVNAAAGAVHVDDAKLAQSIRTNPRGFYVNLHSAEFPGGAVRGQLTKLNRKVDVLKVVSGGGFRALLDADQEVQKPGGSPVGDPNGHAVSFIRPKGTSVGYSLAWVGIAPPTVGHLHEGVRGVNGPVKVELFTTPVPSTIFAISGVAADQDAAVVQGIRKNPRGFYVNVHNAEFKDGAVRGQLLR